MKRSRAFRRPYPAEALTPRNTPNRIALGGLLYAMGDYAAARPLYERTLTIYEVVLGPQHPNTQTVRRNLAALDAAEGRG